jgi:hypothetical protein
MVFLGRIATWVLGILVDVLWTRVSTWVASKIARKKNEDKSQAIADETQKAQTPEERADAAKKAIDNL